MVLNIFQALKRGTVKDGEVIEPMQIKRPPTLREKFKAKVKAGFERGKMTAKQRFKEAKEQRAKEKEAFKTAFRKEKVRAARREGKAKAQRGGQLLGGIRQSLAAKSPAPARDAGGVDLSLEGPDLSLGLNIPKPGPRKGGRFGGFI